MNNIADLIAKSNWHHLINQYKPNILAEKLSLKEGKLLVYKMLFGDTREREDDISDYAVQLLQELRKIHSKEWEQDWRNDVFFGDICYMALRDEERYEAYKRAYDKAAPPPSSLLISLARCYTLWEPPITLDEAEELVKKALEKELSIEGAVLLRGIYAERKDQAKFDYWDKVLEELMQKNIHAQGAWPDFSEAR
jgi:hypothetical protein